VWVLGAVCSMLPDIDVIGFWFGVPYGDLWGHRGFTHSLLFAAIEASAAISWLREPKLADWKPLWAYFFLATASHGLLDAMTDGGLGVGFFAPFDKTRYFLPWRPIQVSPISFSRFFGERGAAVLQSEFLWIWIPAGVLALTVLLARRARQRA
jgi:inner membrane protein